MKNNNTKNLSDDELNVLKKNARDILSSVRHLILSKYPFIGSIALRMDLVPVRDLRVRTACTDGDNIYFDIAFLSSLNTDERMFVLSHEIWHAVLMHIVRCGNRDRNLFNIATDKEVNYMLMQDGLTPPEGLCFPTDKEVGKCAEEIYEMMLKDAKKRQNKQTNGQKESSGSSNSSGQNGNQNGKMSGQFDKHIYDDNTNGNCGNGEDDGNEGSQPNKNGEGSGSGKYSMKITDKYGDVGFDSDYRPKVSKNFADKMRETIIHEAQRVEKMKGDVPANVKELCKKLMTPEIKWQEVLAQFVTKCYNSGNRSWIPPNRRHVHNDVYLQSRQANKIRLVLGIDSSGSTLGDRSKFISELNGLIKSFGRFELTIIECDAQVGDVKYYTQDDDLEHEIDSGNYSMTGGGGTELVHIFNYINENAIEADCVVVLTDGYIDNIPKNPTGLPTLWVITKDGTEDFCDWGQKIRLKYNDNDLV